MSEWTVAFEKNGRTRTIRVPKMGRFRVPPFQFEGRADGVVVRDDQNEIDSVLLRPGTHHPFGSGSLFCHSRPARFFAEQSQSLLKQSTADGSLSQANCVEVLRYVGDFHVGTDYLSLETDRAEIEKLGINLSAWDGSAQTIVGSLHRKTVLVAVTLPDVTALVEATAVRKELKKVGIFVLSFLLWAVIFHLRLMPAEDEEMKIENLPKRFVKFKSAKSEFPFVSARKTSGDFGGQGAKQAKKEGKRGKLTAAQKEAIARQRQARLVKQAKSAGILAVFGGSNGPLKGKKGAVSGAKELKAMVGGMTGSQIGARRGIGASGLKGTGSGGGGVQIAGVGLGVGGKGLGVSGTGTGYIEGGGTGEITLPPLEETILEGSLDKDVIRSVIARYLPQIRACYERVLPTNESLAGKVRTRFVIGTAGGVQKVNIVGSTLGEPAVHRCMKKAMMKWQFPKPKGNGIVRVTYPFLFKPTG